jgi:hypothetical protein
LPVISVLSFAILAAGNLNAFALEAAKGAVSGDEMPVSMTEESKTPYYTLHFSPKYRGELTRHRDFSIAASSL